MSEWYGSHIRVHVEDFPDFRGHFDDTDVAEVNRVTLFRSLETRSRIMLVHDVASLSLHFLLFLLNEAGTEQYEPSHSPQVNASVFSVWVEG